MRLAGRLALLPVLHTTAPAGGRAGGRGKVAGLSGKNMKLSWHTSASKLASPKGISAASATRQRT